MYASPLTNAPSIVNKSWHVIMASSWFLLVRGSWIMVERTVSAGDESGSCKGNNVFYWKLLLYSRNVLYCRHLAFVFWPETIFSFSCWSARLTPHSLVKAWKAWSTLCPFYPGFVDHKQLSISTKRNENIAPNRNERDATRDPKGLRAFPTAQSSKRGNSRSSFQSLGRKGKGRWKEGYYWRVVVFFLDENNSVDIGLFAFLPFVWRQ